MIQEKSKPMNKCTPKELARFKRYRDRHPKRVALSKKKYWDNFVSSTAKGLCMRIRKDCKNRATKRKLEHNISIEYLMKLLNDCNYTCPVFKNKFNVIRGKGKPNKIFGETNFLINKITKK